MLGDRDGGLGSLCGRRFDAVIDMSGHLPRVVRESAELLVGAADHYTFVSSVSAYRDFSKVRIDEEAPLAQLPDDATEDVGQW